MRFAYLLLVQILVIFTCYAQSNIALRTSFVQAATDKTAFGLFKQNSFQTNSQEITPLMKGYMAACWFLQCRYVMNPYEKWQHYLKGKSMLEEAVKEAPLNTELHWLRYAIQTQLPFFLHYHQSEKEDRKLLAQYLKTNSESDRDLYLRIQQLIQQTTPKN